MNTRDPYNLDSLDLKLIRELELDVRQTYKDLAAKLDSNRSVVANRMQRLLDNGILKIICWADPVAVKYKLIVTLSISTQPKQLISVTNKLAACPQVLHLQLCAGRFDIEAFAVFRENQELEDFLLNYLGSMSGILIMEKMLTVQEIKVYSRLLSDEKEILYPQTSEISLDDMDFKLIREFQANPRQRVSTVAQKLGLYHNTVRRKLERLVDGHAIRFRALLDPAVIGYEGNATMRLKCDPDKVSEVAHAVASYKRVLYVSIVVGPYDIQTYVTFKNLIDLQHFISVELSCIPGLREIETLVIYKEIKTLTQIPV